MPIDCVGVRPGEKLHEVLITEDEARTTVELADRYVVEPAIHLYEFKSLTEAGHPKVKTGFFYRSDTNSDWMDVAQTRAMLLEQGYLPDLPNEKPKSWRSAG
jgi:UDP-N-acetylglucosamine 4,6-dehydratase